MSEDRYYCEERLCECFVDKNHRCEQWSNTVRIPGGAIDEIRRECADRAYEWVSNIPAESLYYDGDDLRAAIMGKEAGE